MIANPNAGIGRPSADEFEPYYSQYIDLILDDDLIAILDQQHKDFLSLLGGISEQHSLHRYAPGKWSIREVVNHVSDTERTFAFRAFWFARGFTDALPSFEQEIAASHAEADSVSWAAHIEEFDRVRLSTISLFTNMPTAAWARKGIASGKSISVRALGYLVAGHLAHHVTVLREKYL